MEKLEVLAKDLPDPGAVDWDALYDKVPLPVLERGLELLKKPMGELSAEERAELERFLSPAIADEASVKGRHGE